MRTYIKDIAHIQTGLFAKPAGAGEIVYLQSRHFNEFGQLDAVLHPDLSAKGISEKHLLQDGDVLFAAKGNKNFAAVFENHNEPSVASTSFFVLRILESKILPTFLAWYLNNPQTQAILKAQAIGTSIPSISKQVLESLEIPIPPIATQKSILRIAHLREQEKLLKRKIEYLRDQWISRKLSEAIM